jgi:hypothetical protein
MKVWHKSPLHGQLPPLIPRLFSGPAFWEVRFSEQSKYNVDTDQTDWNKLCGIKPQYFFPLENSIMTGWRYNPKLGVFEVAAYCHVGGKRTTAEEGGFPVCSVNPGEAFTVAIYRDGVGYVWAFESMGKTQSVRIPHNPFFWKGKVWEIASWFGGNRTANVTFEKNFTKKPIK